MSSLRNTLGILSLVAACGPVAAQTASDGETDGGTDSATGTATDDTSAGPGSATEPTGSSDPTASTDPTDPTAPPPECVNSSDCDDSYCGYCEDGMCIEGVGCCGFAAKPARPDMQRFRCSPPYNCYEDGDCDPGEVCTFGECHPPIPVQLPACPPLAATLSQWKLDVTPGAFVLADLDGDGDLDLAAAQPSAGAVRIALNDGAGSFVLAGAFSVGEPGPDLAIVAGDLDGDQDVDLAVLRKDAGGGLILAFGQDAVFTPEKALPTAPAPSDLLLRDIDDDLLNDLVIVSASKVTTRRGADLSAELLALNQAVGGPATLFDLDLSGHADLIARLPESTAIGIHIGDAKGEFTPDVFFDNNKPTSASLGAELSPGDLPALVLARAVDSAGEIDVVHGDPSPQKFGAVTLHQTSAPISGATMLELAAPQGPDLLAATGTPAVLMVLGDGAGGFMCERVIAVNSPTSLSLLAAGDLDGDGIVDLLVGDPGGPEVTTLLGK